ncbi:thermonuclease family protein [Paenibacillus lautus]|uniref:thermonuclease family protein n=1 Tax=Paenibacillus lautus TaxID=1401 RepID=UPI001C7CF24D|nr:thermonuclease family protein [Paenibacillus lautus]MBX4146400.1 thermonuclease family protein [Paenibacillus lautus]
MNKRMLTAMLTALLLVSGCSQPLMSPATSNHETATTVKSEAKSNTSTTNSKQTTYPTDDLNLPRVAVELVKAVDGDTISVMFEGKKENVRMLLIDTPETSHPKLGVQPFGPEAKAFTKELVEQADLLELEFDIGPNRDKYSRLLAYVYADGKMVQESLLEEGLARVAYIYPPNTRYVDKFDDLQRISRDQALGIWSVENYAQEDGFHPEEQDNTNNKNNGSRNNTAAIQAPKENSQESKQGCDIKGNINSKGEKIYHTPESPYYERTKQEQWFCSEAEAVQAGFRAPK